MKKIYFLFTLLSFLSFQTFSQGSENFDNSTAAASYGDGSFVGTNATWSYVHSRDEGDYAINGKGLMLRRGAEPSSLSATISGGIGSFSVNTRKAFTGGTQRSLELVINGNVVAQFEPNYGTGEDTNIYPFIVNDVNTPGDVSVTLRLYGASGNQQMTLDDIAWTGFSGTAPPTIAITNPSNNQELSPGTTSVDLEFTTANLVGGESVTVTVNGTPTTNATSPFAITTADGQSYTVTVDLIDGSGTLDSDTITFSVGTIVPVADVTALRASAVGGTYELSGEAIISYIVTENSRNQKYIQDGNAGILIDDPSGVLTTAFNIGDGLTGLKGELSEFSGVLQFTPIANLATASSTGNTLSPIVITAADLLNNGETYESRLIALDNVTFQDTGVFVDNTNYDVTFGANTTVCRVSFGDEDLIGTAIPTTAVSITGLGGQFNTTYQILPRYISDIGATMSVNNYIANQFSVHPNPVTSGFVNITSKTNDAISVQVFDILGKQVINKTINNNTLDVASLNSGVYILKIAQNGNITTKKLVIK